MLYDHDSSTTSCPECGKDMPMTTWVGVKPKCASCREATTTCLHESLEKSKPINQKGGAHMVACNCPKCVTMC